MGIRDKEHRDKNKILGSNSIDRFVEPFYIMHITEYLCTHWPWKMFSGIFIFSSSLHIHDNKFYKFDGISRHRDRSSSAFAPRTENVITYIHFYAFTRFFFFLSFFQIFPSLSFCISFSRILKQSTRLFRVNYKNLQEQERCNYDIIIDTGEEKTTLL